MVSERLHVVDALRAFALLGIIVSHVSIEFVAGMIPEGYTNHFSAMDKVVSKMVDILTFGKFFTIFSFLFGLSFAIQMRSAVARGDRFTLRFSWRLLILLAIGYVHSLFYSGDILMIYALLGFVLLACRNLSSKALVIAGIVLVLNVPTQFLRVAMYLSPVTAEARATEAARAADMAARAERELQTKRYGTLGEVVAMNASSGFVMRLLFQIFSGRLFITTGLFLLGLAAGRRALFADLPENRRLFRRLLFACVPVVLVATPLAWILNPTLFGDFRSLPVLIGTVFFDLHQAALSAIYLAGFTLLYWTTRSRVLESLAPAGQMGLTVYLTQSVFGVSVFFGFGLGLMGKIGVTAEIALSVAFFALQVWAAGWWMRRFRFGPVEWLWRSLTWLRLQPLRRVDESAAAAGA